MSSYERPKTLDESVAQMGVSEIKTLLALLEYCDVISPTIFDQETHSRCRAELRAEITLLDRANAEIVKDLKETEAKMEEQKKLKVKVGKILDKYLAIKGKPIAFELSNRLTLNIKDIRNATNWALEMIDLFSGESGLVEDQYEWMY